MFSALCEPDKQTLCPKSYLIVLSGRATYDIVGELPEAKQQERAEQKQPASQNERKV